MTGDPALTAIPIPDLAAAEALRGSVAAIVHAQFRNTEYLTVTGGQIHSADVYFGASYADGKFMAKKPE